MRITANQVTLSRCSRCPSWVSTLFGSARTQVIGVIIGTLIGLTDFVDGYLARKHGPTVLGSLLDPVADKIFIVVCYGCFVARGGMPWWIAAAIFSREFLVTVLRSSLELGGRRLRSSGVAKAKTWVQMIAFAFLVLIPIVGPGTGLPILFGIPLGVAVTVLATVAGRPQALARLRDRRAGDGPDRGRGLPGRQRQPTRCSWPASFSSPGTARSTTSAVGLPYLRSASAPRAALAAPGAGLFLRSWRWRRWRSAPLGACRSWSCCRA